jgi:hypothetical protein
MHMSNITNEKLEYLDNCSGILLIFKIRYTSPSYSSCNFELKHHNITHYVPVRLKYSIMTANDSDEEENTYLAIIDLRWCLLTVCNMTLWRYDDDH